MFLKPKLRRLLIKIQELKVKGLQNVKIARKDKAGLHGPGGKLPVRTGIALPAVAAQNQPVAAPSPPVAAIPLNPTMLRNIWVSFEINNEPILPLPGYVGYVDFDPAEILGTALKLDRFIRRVIKTHERYIHCATRSSINEVLEDPDLSHKAWIALQKHPKGPVPIGFPNRPNSTVADLFRFVDKLLGLNKATQNSEIVFVLPIVLNENYPLDDPRNDVKPHIDDLTDDSIEERHSRSARGSSLGVTHQPGRKRSKTPKSKDRVPRVLPRRIIRNTVKVPELDPWDEDELVDRPEELLSVYAFWRRELVRLEHDVGPLPPPSAQPSPPPEAPVESPPPSPSSADLFVMGASTSAGSEKNTGGDGTAVEEKSMVEGAKKRGKALKGVGILDGAQRRSSRVKGKGFRGKNP
jgi:hypothetical protein